MNTTRMITGINLMLVGIYVIGNSTNPDRLVEPERYNRESDLNDFSISLAGQNQNLQKSVIPKTLTITSLQALPYSNVEKFNGTIRGNISTHAFYIFELIRSKLNFTYQIVMPDKQIFGHNDSGVVQLLIDRKVDLAVAFLPMSPDMYPYISYSTMLAKIDLMVMMQRPSESAIGSGLLAPFNDTVWKCILLVLAIIGPVIFIITSFKCYLWNNTKVDKYTFTECVWFTYGAILKQGSIITPTSDSIRVLFASWWIFITILTSFYTANLTAFLTLSEFTLPFKTIADVVSSGRPWFSISEHYIDYAINRTYVTELEGLKKSWKAKRGQFIPETSDQRILQMLNSKKLFLGEYNHVKTLIIKDYLKKTKENKIREGKRCTYVIMPKTIRAQPVAFAFQKNSPMMETFNKHLRNIVEAGILKHLKTMELPAVDYCPLNLNSKERRLKNTDLALTYEIVCGGFIVATIVFIFEKYFQKKKERIVYVVVHFAHVVKNESLFEHQCPEKPHFDLDFHKIIILIIIQESENHRQSMKVFTIRVKQKNCF